MITSSIENTKAGPCIRARTSETPLPENRVEGRVRFALPNLRDYETSQFNILYTDRHCISLALPADCCEFNGQPAEQE